MLKKNEGVTIIGLVSVVIVMLILVGVTAGTATTLIRDTRLKQYITTMQLIRAKAMNMYESYEFGESNVLIGEMTSGVEVGYGGNAGEWRKWTSTHLEKCGINTQMLSGNRSFLVDYKNGEVIYTGGYVKKDGGVIYKLSEMESQE